MKSILLALAMITIAAHLGAATKALAADETWPVRLMPNGDETWPLRFAGHASTIPGHPSRTVDTELDLRFITNSVMAPEDSANLLCRSNASTLQKHAAGGVIVVNGKTHQIRGVCFNTANDEIEFVALHQQGSTVDQASMTTSLPEDSGALTFRGRLTITGQGRYAVVLNHTSGE